MNAADDGAPEEPQGAPSRVGRYIVLQTIGVGGMGLVCTAYDPKLDRKVALKLLHARSSDAGRRRTHQARLVREAQALAKLSHPNIVTVHDVDTHQGRLYIAMEYVEGRSLDEWLHTEHPWREIVEVFTRAGLGLAAAHRAGITHRDFKPGNVQVGDDGRVRVLDFGLAKSGETESFVEEPLEEQNSPADFRAGIMELVGSATDLKLTQVGRAVGTPAYMAPEQFWGRAVGPEADQFGFGAALYEALYGRLPFADEDDPDFAECVCTGLLREPPPGTPVPGWVHRVVARTLKIEPRERFASMEDVLAALGADPARRRRKIALGVAGVGVVMAAGAASAALGGAAEVEVCRADDDRIAVLWSDTTRETIESAFVATGKPYAEHAWNQVAASLDDYAARWTAHHHAICEATHVRREQSEVLLDLRMACLNLGRAELSALVGVFSDADAAVVQNAVAAAYGLIDIDGCSSALPETVGALPVDPGEAERAAEIEARIAQARVLISAGQYESAVAIAEPALQDARDLDHPPTLARALFLLGATYSESKRSEEAAGLLMESVRAAATAGVAADEARAWSSLLYVEGYRLERFDGTLAMRLGAESAMARAGDPIEQAAWFALDLGAVLGASGKLDESLEQFRRSVMLWRTVERTQTTGLATALKNLGVALAKKHDYAEAVSVLNESLEITRSLHGDRHPAVAGAATNLGHVLADTKQQDRARESYALALAVLSANYGPEHPRAATALVGLANVERDAGNYDEAAEYLRRGLAMLTAAGAPPGQISTVLNAVADNELDAAEAAAELAGRTEHLERARQSLTQAISILVASPSAGPLAVSHHRMCRALTELGELDGAVDSCTAAATMFADSDAGFDPDRLETQLNLARALGLDPSRTAAARERAQLVLAAPAATAKQRLAAQEILAAVAP